MRDDAFREIARGVEAGVQDAIAKALQEESDREFEINRAIGQAVLDFDRALASLNVFDFAEARNRIVVGQRSLQASYERIKR
jgi:hypothetical protein